MAFYLFFHLSLNLRVYIDIQTETIKSTKAQQTAPKLSSPNTSHCKTVFCCLWLWQILAMWAEMCQEFAPGWIFSGNFNPNGSVVSENESRGKHIIPGTGNMARGKFLWRGHAFFHPFENVSPSRHIISLWKYYKPRWVSRLIPAMGQTNYLLQEADWCACAIPLQLPMEGMG